MGQTTQHHEDTYHLQSPKAHVPSGVSEGLKHSNEHGTHKGFKLL